MNIKRKLQVGIISLALTITSSFAISQSLSKDKNSAKTSLASIADMQKARVLGVDLNTYRKIGLFSTNTDIHKHFDNVVDIKNHPAKIEITSLLNLGQDIPDVLMEEYENLHKLNDSSIADQLGMSVDRLQTLSFLYQRLNIQSSVSDKHLDDYNYFSHFFDGGGDEEPDPDMEVIKVTLKRPITNYQVEAALEGNFNGGLGVRLSVEARNAYGEQGTGFARLILQVEDTDMSIHKFFEYKDGDFNYNPLIVTICEGATCTDGLVGGFN